MAVILFFSNARNKGYGRWHAGLAFCGWNFWCGHRERNNGKNKSLDFALSFVSANTYFVSLAFNLPSLDALVIQGCIVRGQWWSVETESWNCKEGQGNASGHPSGLEARWCLHIDIFWAGDANWNCFVNELTRKSCGNLHLVFLLTYLLTFCCSHTSGVRYLKLLILHGQWNGAPLVMDSIISSTPWRR